jgi:hypothetical protein
VARLIIRTQDEEREALFEGKLLLLLFFQMLANLFLSPVAAMAAAVSALLRSRALFHRPLRPN